MNTSFGYHTVFSRYLDEYGNPVERTPETNPCSYDTFMIYRKDVNEKVNYTCWSDRLWQWDYKKYNELCLKHFGNQGQVFYDREPNLIQKFLRDYLEDDQLELIYIMQGCNQSSGYPLWLFAVKTSK